VGRYQESQQELAREKPRTVPPLAGRLAVRRRHMVELVTACAVALVPWTIVLALTLPRSYDSRHWRLTWVGFDVLLLIMMALTAFFGWRRRQAVIASAVVTGTLLVCDAWFDISLDLGTSGIWMSLASAVLIELPLALFLFSRARLLIKLTVQLVLPGEDGQLPAQLPDLPMLAAREAAED
jgi:hypothetical protein